MLLKDKLKNWRLVLGSGSPRRKELLAYFDIPFTVDDSSNTPEIINHALQLSAVAPDLSLQKSRGFHRELEPDEILITADTIVICKDQILGKPKDNGDARRMLHMISGCTHQVSTGVTIRTVSKQLTFCAVSRVTFRELTNQEIDYYIENYKPFDKAGAYGIQEWIGSVGVTGIEGSFYNVMGLPVQMLHDRLLAFDL
ncbi:MAG: Maf family nucleotide pyrophosphatase [Bacteroidaceae bacterium]|nr:Maf family nucleotide pyrophosphatase [Bacteroidaceae bacterium]